MTVNVRKKSNDALKRKLEEGLKTLQTKEVKVGWFGTGDKYGKDAWKAYSNEFGTITTRKENGETFQNPPRPFIFRKLKNRFSSFKKYSILGKTKALGLLKNLGRIMVENIQQSIDEVNTPPLSGTTLWYRRKHGNSSEKPLIDTGNMRKNVKVKIGERNAE